MITFSDFPAVYKSIVHILIPVLASKTAKDVYKRQSHADEEDGTLNEVSPQHALQTTRVGVYDGDDAHDDDQNIYVNVGERREHHAGQIHDDGRCV